MPQPDAAARMRVLRGEQADLLTAVDRHAGSLIDWSTLWDLDRATDDWLIEPFVARGRGHSIYAPPKGKKSLFTLAVAAHAATGRPVLHQPASEPFDILYLDLEMTTDDVRDRLTDMGFGPDDDLSRLHYHTLPSLPPLDSANGGAEVVELAQAYGAAWVIVDTTSRVLAGPENESDTMRNFYSYTGRPLKSLGVALTRLDHAGKDIGRGQRGTSAKADDVDVVWRLLPKDQNQFDLKATHRRMGWIPEVVHLRQHSDPLRFEITDDSCPAGTLEAMRSLDDIDAPIEWGRDKCRSALKTHNVTVSTDALTAAIRQRKRDATSLEGLTS